MKSLIKNISISLLLGGLWALFLHIVFSFVSMEVIKITFYPSLFTGFLFINAYSFDLDIKLPGLIITGLLAGLGYHFLSSYFPLISILFIVAVFSSGFSGQRNRALDAASIMLKGAVSFILGIIAVNFLISLSVILVNLPQISWFLLGAVINLCTMITIIPLQQIFDYSSKVSDYDHEIDEMAEFQSQAAEIIRELNAIDAN